VAVKLVSPSLVGDARFVDSLKQECRRLDKLDHANIVRFRDLVLDERQVAMVLELLDGEDLHARLGRGPLPASDAAEVVLAILEGLSYAHAQGVLHRDIKPGNVYWCSNGRIKLLDFGIARAADSSQATKTGQLVGTFDYMAPERFDGSGTASSDVYAVGLIALELVTGRSACPDGELPRKMRWHVLEGVGDAGSVQSKVPGCPGW
jgi:serine/threonine protein kinase